MRGGRPRGGGEKGRRSRGSDRVNRGGSWRNDHPANFRGANRNRNDPANRNDNQGFRLVSTDSRQGLEAVPSAVTCVPFRRERNRPQAAASKRGPSVWPGPGKRPAWAGQRRRKAPTVAARDFNNEWEALPCAGIGACTSCKQLNLKPLSHGERGWGEGVGNMTTDTLAQAWREAGCPSPLAVNAKDGSVLVYVPEGEFEMGDGQDSDGPK
ncbi:MAG: SUMF1/EgtB/PvdO family nonheme iron enzyme, partial [Methylococcus sp.]